MATVEFDRDLYRLLTFHEQNLVSLFHGLGQSRPEAHVSFRNKGSFYGEELLATCANPNLGDYILSPVRDCLFNIFATTIHTGCRSSIRNLRTRHAVVTGTHLSWEVVGKQYIHIYACIYLFIYACMYVNYLFSKKTLVYADCDDNTLNPLGLEGADLGGIFSGLECQRTHPNINTDFFSSFIP